MAPHEFVHLGDLHLRPDARNDDRLAALDQAIETARRELEYIAAWLWPGDLNDRRMAIDDRNALAQRLLLMANIAPVVICYGNHDMPGDLDIFQRLASVHPIYVVAQPHVLEIKTATEAIASIFVLPYPTKGALVAAGRQGDELLADADHCLEAIFIHAAAELETARATGHLTLMIGHVNVGGAIASAGQPQIGREIELTPGHLGRLGDIPKLLNHIHKPQQVHGADYAGSMCRLNWGEVEDKRFQVVVFTAPDAWVITSKPIDVPPMWHVEGDLTADTFNWVVKAGPEGAPLEPPESWAGSDVRVRYRFAAGQRATVNELLVSAAFAGARRLELDPVAVPDQALRAPEVAAASTLEDKLVAWADLTDVARTLDSSPAPTLEEVTP